jgi:hypothetical protein
MARDRAREAVKTHARRLDGEVAASEQRVASVTAEGDRAREQHGCAVAKVEAAEKAAPTADPAAQATFRGRRARSRTTQGDHSGARCRRSSSAPGKYKKSRWWLFLGFGVRDASRRVARDLRSLLEDIQFFRRFFRRGLCAENLGHFFITAGAGNEPYRACTFASVFDTENRVLREHAAQLVVSGTTRLEHVQWCPAR